MDDGLTKAAFQSFTITLSGINKKCGVSSHLLAPVRQLLQNCFTISAYIHVCPMISINIPFLLQAHINICDHTVIICVHTQCPTKVKRYLLAKHLEEECLYRSVKCENCQETLPFASIEVCHRGCRRVASYLLCRQRAGIQLSPLRSWVSFLLRTHDTYVFKKSRGFSAVSSHKECMLTG